MEVDCDVDTRQVFVALDTLLQRFADEQDEFMANGLQYLQRLRSCDRNLELTEYECILLLRTLERAVGALHALASDVTVETVRLLRNGCANNRSVQDAITRNERFNDVLHLLLSKMMLTRSEADTEETLAKNIICSRCILQFLGNLVVNNDGNKLIIWSSISQHFEWLIGQASDNVVKRYTCMLLYNCLKDVPSRRRQLFENHQHRLISQLLNLAMQEEVEWALYIIELMLGDDHFLMSCMPELESEKRYFLLDVIIDCLKNLNVSSLSATTQCHPSIHFQHPTTQCISKNNLDFLKEQFVAKVDTMLNMVHSLDVNSEEPVIIMKLLRIFCCASCVYGYREYLQTDGSLVVIVTYFLKSVHLAGKEGAEYFAPVEKLFENDPEKHNPVHGVKSDLIRLIGNLCWEHKGNQDKVREMDGISTLLDCCKIDAHNPFIIQWVIFAIHNLCDKNPENQALIASMENLGLAPKSQSDNLPNGSSSSDAAERGSWQNGGNDVTQCAQLFEEMNVSETRATKTRDDSDINDLFF